MTPQERLKEIRERHSYASGGTWLADSTTIFHYNEKNEPESIAGTDSLLDTAFIAHAHQDIPFLLESVRILTEGIIAMNNRALDPEVEAITLITLATIDNLAEESK